METTADIAAETESSKSGKLFFQCNVCLDMASSPVVTLCGHLYCSVNLNGCAQWMQNHSECPVCKAGISEENVVPVYARGAEAVDRRTHQQTSNNGIPNRPRGQRPDAEQLRRRHSYNFGIFNGSGQGNPFSMSPIIGFFPALFGVPYQPPAPVTHHQDGTPLTPQETRQQMQQAFLSRFLLIVGSLVILCLITF
ncbi:Ring finger protein 5 [Phytophthora megakarya]|uniref:RING-type E3 ubiquitin transferase n=1 Tax=Phytophthora megakarya TaxID=4795 RepID=A0A225VFS8_9STRA|nr:Ring finger protein 5 [Phytophthora megakarya]